MFDLKQDKAQKLTLSESSNSLKHDVTGPIKSITLRSLSRRGAPWIGSAMQSQWMSTANVKETWEAGCGKAHVHKDPSTTRDDVLLCDRNEAISSGISRRHGEVPE